MRWFGPGDTVSLAEIRQTGATAIFSALHEIAAGEAWPAEIRFAADSPLEGTGFELLVRGRVKLVVGRGRQRN